MKLSQLKTFLEKSDSLNFKLEDGTQIPPHFHVTEAGLTTKNFIDCGGTLRTEKNINFQVWVASDTDHRLEPQKLNKIISISESHFGNEDLDVEVEYQTNTIGRYGLKIEGENLILTSKATDCLAKENCGVSDKVNNVIEKVKSEASSCCSPGSGCC